MLLTQNIHIESIKPIITPNELKEKLFISKKISQEIINYRNIIKNIINQNDPRIMAIVGPCSIHNPDKTINYAKKLFKLHQKYKDKIFILMRVYFEKPRTTIGWKGLINDPDLNGTCNISKGLYIARELLIKISEIGLSIATEMLDPISPQYTSDLISWASIGARTTESQVHREMASGLSMPIGYKNGTDGGLGVAISALKVAKHSHSFLGTNELGQTSIIKTKGNPHGHLILRGGKNGPNYNFENVEKAIDKLKRTDLNSSIVVDCSHANSSKNYLNQVQVLHNVIDQIGAGNKNIIGFMLESNINEGNQKIPLDLAQLKYGVSVTDACINWETTENLLEEIYFKL
ncbi:MAG: 3-deoxy-7-phosphoheptulonate synthase [Candidatus Nanoarchaeia archaeon]|nr:3-deoxy-7-phosphoheptulonate synthase [Candidatus Nanoarchaeia archaeon]